MPPFSPILLFGGAGVFGGHVARELVRRGLRVTIAGRSRRRTDDAARQLGPGCNALVADVNDFASCRRALVGQRVAVNCAGPFSNLNSSLLDACLEAGCHYVDITDERRYAALVRSRHEAFRAKGLVAAYGCSSLPGVSEALAMLLRDSDARTPAHARVTLIIGNRNPKGAAAVESFVRNLGKPIAAPQGPLRGFGQREVVPLPRPFGPRGVFSFESPDYELLPERLGVKSVSVKVGFELRLVTYSLAVLAAVGSNYGPLSARFLRMLATPFARIGSSGGAVLTELFYADGQVRRAALVARADGQRMAALPCVLAARALCADKTLATGAVTASELLGHRVLLDALVAAGFNLHLTES